MKQIFHERSEAGSVLARNYDDETDRIYTDRVSVALMTDAHYDDKQGVLVVDQHADIYPERYGYNGLLWTLPAQRTLETHLTAASATRRAVALADEYLDRLTKAAFDDERSDDEVRATYNATREDKLAF